MGERDSSMGEIVIQILKWTAKYVFYIAMVTAFVVILNLVVSAVFIGFNAGAFSDVYSMVTLWLPFNLPVVMAWLMTASTAYIGYRLAVKSVVWLQGFLA